MSKQTFPVYVDQPGCTMRNFRVTGATVSAVAPSSAGLDGRGQFLCTAFKAVNVVTLEWITTFGDVPYVFPQPSAGQADTLVEIVTSTATTLVYRTFSATTNAPLNDANVDFHVDGYNTASFVS